jgi:hypothetical protein
VGAPICEKEKYRHCLVSAVGIRNVSDLGFACTGHNHILINKIGGQGKQYYQDKDQDRTFVGAIQDFVYNRLDGGHNNIT